MMKYQELLKTHQDDIAKILSKENGKTFEDAKGDVWRGIEVVEQAANITPLLMGETVENVAREIDSYSYIQSLGVCLGITPFNFPAMIPLWMFPMAIACGNTFILKPSEQDPMTSNKLAELFVEAGAPPNILQVIHGNKEQVDILIKHPDIKAISFVGSVPVGQYIYKTGTEHLKRVQSFAGAKNHMVVLPDADLEQAALAAVSAGYGSTGQRCMAISVVVAHEAIADALVERIVAHSAQLRLGEGTAEGVEMGPLISAQQREKVLRLVESGVNEGATLAHDGRNSAGNPGGFFVGPCLFDHVRPEMEIYREEIFGPVLCVVRVPSLDSALSLVNANPYGNGAAVFTASGGAGEHFVTQVEAGMVGVNVAIPVPVAWHSFGGWGDSLFGDTHVYGPEGVRFYTRGKVVTTRWTSTEASRPDLGFPGGGKP